MSNIDYPTNIDPHQYPASKSMIRDVKAVRFHPDPPCLYDLEQKQTAAVRLPRAIERVNIGRSTVHEVVPRSETRRAREEWGREGMSQQGF